MQAVELSPFSVHAFSAMSDEPPRSADLTAGYDEGDPYDGCQSSYPEWWQQNVELFREHEMRPYCPARFADGAVVPDIVVELEADLGVDVALRAVGHDAQGAWNVVVDGCVVREIERTRTSEAFTRYALDSTVFERIVRDAANG